MLPTCNSAGEVPNQPGIDGAHNRPARGRLVRQPLNVVQQPGCLRTAEVGGQGKTGPVSEPVDATFPGQILAYPVGPGVLPDDGIGQWPAALAVPHHGCLSLVGDTDPHQVPDCHSSRAQRLAHHRLNSGKDLPGVMFHPPRTRKDLPEFPVSRRHHCSGTVEDHESGAGGSLIDGSYRSSNHAVPSIPQGRRARSGGSNLPAANDR